MLRVTTDSNIYISALHFGGVPDKVLDLARTRQIQLAISSAILIEVARVLSGKFGWSQPELETAKALIGDFTDWVQPLETINAVLADPTDNRILECALAGRSDFLVTGDNHLLRLGTFRGVRIVSPGDFLKLLERALDAT